MDPQSVSWVLPMGVGGPGDASACDGVLGECATIAVWAAAFDAGKGSKVSAAGEAGLAGGDGESCSVGEAGAGAGEDAAASGHGATCSCVGGDGAAASGDAGEGTARGSAPPTGEAWAGIRLSSAALGQAGLLRAAWLAKSFAKLEFSSLWSSWPFWPLGRPPPPPPRSPRACFFYFYVT